MNFTPLYDRILVKREEAEDMSGDIYIPDTAKSPKFVGVVIAVGEGRIADTGEIKPLRVKVGDHVMFGKYAGTEVEIEDEKFIVVSEAEVLGKFTDAP